MNVRYSRQYNPQGSTKNSDQAVKKVSRTFKWIPFLNESIVLHGSTFINDPLTLDEFQSNPGTVE